MREWDTLVKIAESIWCRDVTWSEFDFLQAIIRGEAWSKEETEELKKAAFTGEKK